MKKSINLILYSALASVFILVLGNKIQLALCLLTSIITLNLIIKNES